MVSCQFLEQKGVRMDKKKALHEAVESIAKCNLNGIKGLDGIEAFTVEGFKASDVHRLPVHGTVFEHIYNALKKNELRVGDTIGSVIGSAFGITPTSVACQELAYEIGSPGRGIYISPKAAAQRLYNLIPQP